MKAAENVGSLDSESFDESESGKSALVRLKNSKNCCYVRFLALVFSSPSTTHIKKLFEHTHIQGKGSSRETLTHRNIYPFKPKNIHALNCRLYA